MTVNRARAPEYIGDGVYAEFVDGMMRVTTHNGVRVTNEVFLGPGEFDALLAFARRFEFSPETQP